jgi:release factor glutamine methyltransferase
MGVDEVWLRMHPDAEVALDVADHFGAWLERRAAGEPAHHLIGCCTFFGRSFEVSSQVLVPRPESELVIETALELPLTVEAKVVDVGAGSGCLAITLALERPRWRVVAVERSLMALDVARTNRDLHGAQVDLMCGDLGHAFVGGFDLVVANLPYIPTRSLAKLPPEVHCDPPLALDGGRDGLTLVRGLLADLERLLKPCGGAVLELGEGQAEVVAEVALGAGLGVARRIRDVGGCERVMVLQRR